MMCVCVCVCVCVFLCVCVCFCVGCIFVLWRHNTILQKKIIIYCAIMFSLFLIMLAAARRFCFAHFYSLFFLLLFWLYLLFRLHVFSVMQTFLHCFLS